MPFLFRCPHCETETEVDDQYAGRSGPCAVCGKTITVPQLSRPGRGHVSASSGRPAVSVPVILAVTIIGLLLAGSLIALGVALVRPVVFRARNSVQIVQCENNLKQIALAMRSYAADHGSLPPAAVTDANGQPMHSWRVLLLPYLGHQATYDRYNFSQPWDSPDNLLLQYEMPSVYACPSDGDALGAQETSYMVVTGRRTLFPIGKTTSLDAVTDGLADTILVVETQQTAVCWLKPTDLDARRLQFEMNGGSGEVGSRHPGGAHVATADGEVHFLVSEIAPDVLRALTTIAGGELIPWRRIEDR
jgi:hypothetical protein